MLWLWRNIQTILIPGIVASLWHCHGYMMVEYVASCAHVESHFFTHICATQMCYRPVRGTTMRRMWSGILAVGATSNAMWCPSSALNTFSFLIQDKILPQGKWIIMCLHIGRYGINCWDLLYLANSCGACCLMYRHMAYSADSGRWKLCWSDCVDFMAQSIHSWGWSSRD